MCLIMYKFYKTVVSISNIKFDKAHLSRNQIYDYGSIDRIEWHYV
jgi:hypothetical protein